MTIDEIIINKNNYLKNSHASYVFPSSDINNISEKLEQKGLKYEIDEYKNFYIYLNENKFYLTFESSEAFTMNKYYY